MGKAGLLALGLLLTLLLGVLAGGIWGTPFRGGKPLPVAPPETGGAGAAPFDELAFLRFLVRALHVLLLVSVFVTILTFIFFPEYRRQILRFFLVAAVAGFLAYLVVSALLRMEPPAQGEAQQPVAGPGPGEAESEAGEEPPSAPEWLVYLVGVVGGGLLAWWAMGRLSGRVRLSRRVNRELSRAAGDAAAELRAGAPVADVVARCWLRMVEILSREAGVRDAPQITPEELAGELARRGFSHWAIWVLTRLFEEVRYGRKAAEPRRDEALAALAAIERAYASRD